MVITAKFSSVCPQCGRAIDVGDQVEWAKGSRACHVGCSGTKARTVGPGEQRIQSRRSSRTDTSCVVGDTIYAPKVAGGVGPWAEYWTVVATWIDAPNEDMGDYDWIERSIVRPATEAEVAPVAARRTARETRDALARDLKAAPGVRVPGRLPDDAKVIVPRNPLTSCATGERIAIIDGAVHHERVGDPDMCDSWYHYVVRLEVDAEMMARVVAFIAS